MGKRKPPVSDLEKLRRLAEAPPPPTERQHRLVEARRLAQKLLALDMEALTLYRPLPPAERFHASRARIRIPDGTNQSGKTLAAEIELARAVSGLDPYNKYPKRDGVFLCVGYDEKHIGTVMWRTLARPGAFSIIRDEHTKLMRSVRPDANNPLKLDPYDEAYREKWRDAPPILPPRLIRNVVWEARGLDIPAHVELTTGWKILWRTSKGDPARGIQIHGWHFDEEIKNQGCLAEALRACIRHDAPGFWSATPQTGGAQFYNLHHRAEDPDDHDVEAFTFYIEENPYFTPEAKRAFFDSLSEDEREVRYFGKYARAGRRIYPGYDPMGEHGCEPFEAGQPPADWAREVIVDPSRQHCGTLFGAIDPDEKHVWIYDGFDLQQAHAGLWADMVQKRQGDRAFERFIIDGRYGKQHHGASAQTLAEQYWAALESRDIRPRRRYIGDGLGGFFPGSADVSGREEALLNWMTIRHEGPFRGTAKLKVVRGCCPKLDQQIRNASMSIERPDKRVKQEEDVLVCGEYWAASNPVYYPPETVAETKQNRVAKLWAAKQDRLRHTHQHANGPGHVFG